MKKILWLSIGIILILSCQQNTTNKKAIEISTSLNNLFDKFYDEYLKLDPLTATSLGDNRFNDTIPNYFSQAFKNQNKLFFKSYLDKLSEFNRDELSESDKLNFDLLKWLAEINLEYFQYKTELIPLNQFGSLQIYFPTLATSGVQPLNNTEDYEKWLKRIDDFVVNCDTAILNMRRGSKVGYTLPKSITSRMIEQTNSFLNQPIQENVFYTPLKNFPDSISADDRKSIEKEYISKIENKIIPLYTRLRDFLKDSPDRKTNLDGRKLSLSTKGQSAYSGVIK